MTEWTINAAEVIGGLFVYVKIAIAAMEKGKKMDVKEKLVKLLKNAKSAMKSENLSCDIARNMFVVDFMMANGVTVQECGQWIYDFNLTGSNFYRCSVCDRQETLLEKEDIYEYCPFCHCGAKMIPQPPKGE